MSKRIEQLSIDQLRRVLIALGKHGLIKGASKRQMVRYIYTLTGQEIPQ